MTRARLDSLLAAGRHLTRGLLQLFWPAACMACDAALAQDQLPFCPACRAALTTDSHTTCPRCAATVGPYTASAAGCGHCRELSYPVRRTIRLGTYEGLLRDVVLRIKHAHNEGLAELVGEAWAEYAEARLRELGAHVVVPVPLHWLRRLRRGYNQSEALAGALAARLGVPCRPGWLRRVRYTPRQTAAGVDRQKNVRGAFAARRRPELAGKTVLLVDDVLTTGSTCGEAAKALLAAGAGSVVVAVLARADA